MLNGCHRAGAAANTDKGGVLGLQSCSRHDVTNNEMGLRTRRSDTDSHPLQACGTFETGCELTSNADRYSRESREQHCSGDGLALGLKLDRVIVSAGSEIGASAHHCL